MGRKKVEMKLIENKRQRDETFAKRKSTIIKKAKQLTTLCDIQVCVILFGPNGETPYVFPKDPKKVNNILTRYWDTPVDVREKRALNPSSLAQKPDEKGVTDVYQLMELMSQLDAKIELVKRRIEAEKFNRNMTMMIQNPRYYNQFPLVDSYNRNQLFEVQKPNVEMMNTVNGGGDWNGYYNNGGNMISYGLEGGYYGQVVDYPFF